MHLMKSWVESANSATTDFPLNNLPYGVFSQGGNDPHCGVAIGDQILDVTLAEQTGILKPADHPVFGVPYWNSFMGLGPDAWAAFRDDLQGLLSEKSAKRPTLEPFLVSMVTVEMHIPFAVSEYTDFYASQHHALNVGTMLRGADNALPPNWLHMPIGYNGRASSVVVSGSGIRRPWGQLKPLGQDVPHFAPTRRFDFELEMGAIVGKSSEGMVTVKEADQMIFGYVLLNDWSARDVQGWEYQPLGPFQAKATATSISPWIVTTAALKPFRTLTPHREVDLLPHLLEPGPMLYNIALDVALAPAGKPATMITQTNYAQMYYSAPQQLAHHTTSGCPMTVGDLLGSGTITGPDRTSRGSLLELSWGGQDPILLDTGESRSFLEDGDTVILSGAAVGNGFRIGFGTCAGTILAAQDNPYRRENE